MRLSAQRKEHIFILILLSMAPWLVDMADLAHWQHLASDAVNWISDYVQHNKVTSSLIATNAVLLTWYLIWKSTRRQRLLDKIPALAGYPLVGDVLSMEADPCGE